MIGNCEYPLVSILVPNFNYSGYLDECIQSALGQTYRNLEIVILDNQSTDDSLKIAMRYRSAGVRLCRNLVNLQNTSYRMLADDLSGGEFMMLLCSDDSIHPTFIEKAVAVMRRYPTVGYVHGERDFVSADGAITEIEPFFNQSFVAPGKNVMPLYMVTTIAHPSQGVFRRSAFRRIGGYEQEVDHANADKALWFYLSSVSDYGYIREKMCRIRFNPDSDGGMGVRNLQHPVLLHQTICAFARFARRFDYSAAAAREEEGLFRLADEFLLHAGLMLIENRFDLAKTYLLYAHVLNRNLAVDAHWSRLMKMCRENEVDLEYIRGKDLRFTARRRNYPPPHGFEKIAMGDLV